MVGEGVSHFAGNGQTAVVFRHGSAPPHQHIVKGDGHFDGAEWGNRFYFHGVYPLAVVNFSVNEIKRKGCYQPVLAGSEPNAVVVHE